MPLEMNERDRSSTRQKYQKFFWSVASSVDLPTPTVSLPHALLENFKC